jgi:hypothetical protein
MTGCHECPAWVDDFVSEQRDALTGKFMMRCLPHSPKSNLVLHRITARLRFDVNPKGLDWAARDGLQR